MNNKTTEHAKERYATPKIQDHAIHLDKVREAFEDNPPEWVLTLVGGRRGMSPFKRCVATAVEELKLERAQSKEK